MKKEILSKELLEEYTRVAYYSYKANLTQEEIGKKMSISRQRVNRILSDCVRLGIVKISIEGDGNENIDLEMALEKKYNLRACVVVNNYVPENIHKDLGVGAGKYLDKLIKDGDIIGFSRGRSISEIASNISSKGMKDITVTQLLGSENNALHTNESDDIVYRISQKLNAKPKLLYAPVIVKSSELRDSMIKDPYFSEAYKVLKACDIAVFGIGTANSQQRHMSLLGAKDEDWGENIVGEICSHYFDERGKSVITSFQNRIIAIALEDFQKIPIRIGVAGLPEKAEAIRAGLVGHWLNVLVVDEQTAKILI